jgi:cell division cycle 14
VLILTIDRVYLASYTHPPNELTPFPYPTPTRSPFKRSSKSQAGPTPVPNGPKAILPVYFSVDDTLLYNRFHADFGPLHIGHLYRFAVQLHEILGDPANADRGVVFWSKADSRSRANAACLLACYMVLIQSWPPHLALAPIAQADPPLMPFRDAGYSQADYGLSVQDVVYGVWKAKEEGLCGLKDFSLEE